MNMRIITSSNRPWTATEKHINVGRQNMRERKTRHRRKCRRGKCYRTENSAPNRRGGKREKMCQSLTQKIHPIDID